MAEADAAALFGESELRAWAATPSVWPTTLAELEPQLGLGRACAREDSRETYAMEERSSRFGGVQRDAPSLRPRVAISGCRERRASESLWIAQTSPVEAGAHGTTARDPIALAPVEIMAWDGSAGRYLFFEFLADERGPLAVRLEPLAGGRTLELRARPGQPLERREFDAPRCFGCHVHGEPMLNELTDPWLGWVSSSKLQLARSDYEGESAALLAESVGQAGRVSQASALEVTVRAGMRQLAARRAEQQPEQAARALFCPTTLNFVSHELEVPDALLADAALLRTLGLATPTPKPPELLLRQVPVRGHMDELLVSAWLQLDGLAPELALAARLLDDQDDLSPVRCALWDELGDSWAGSERPERDAALRAVLRARLDAAAWREAPRGQLLSALLEGPAAPALLEGYRGELIARMAARAADLEGMRNDFSRRWQLAEALFARPESPLPRQAASAMTEP